MTASELNQEPVGGTWPSCPFQELELWFEEALSKDEVLPEAAALATTDGQGMPDVRMVLVKTRGPQGFLFYTNLGSPKAKALEANPVAALLFHWKSLARQVRVRGRVVPVDEATADAYFASRARESQYAAWASDQSQPLDGGDGLAEKMASVAQRFPEGPVPRPPFWGGYRLIPEAIELWREGAFRVHTRVLFREEGGVWVGQGLQP